MGSVVERIRSMNPRINAIVQDLTVEALAKAGEADRALATLWTISRLGTEARVSQPSCDSRR